MSNARWPMGRKSTIMLEPDNRFRYLIYTFVLILFLIICKAVYGEEITHAKVKPFENQGQYCFVEVKIVVENDEVIKKECTATPPSYYCRNYSLKNVCESFSKIDPTIS